MMNNLRADDCFRQPLAIIYSPYDYTSIVSLDPRRKAYSRMAASARLIYSLQQS